MLMFWGSGFRVKGLGCRVWGFQGLWLSALGCRDSGAQGFKDSV